MPRDDGHERLSPSGSGRWLVCSHSLNAPATPPTAATKEGDEAHYWSEKTLKGECGILEVPQKFQAGVAMYVNHVKRNQVEPIVERKWDSIEIPNFGGTIDCLLIRGPQCVVYDFKFGKWPVGAEDNPQMLCYSTIVAEHFDVSEFHGVIVQPRAMRGPKIKVAQYSQAQVETHREKVRYAAANDYKATGDHCRFCSLRTTGACGEGVAYGIQRGWK